MAELFILLSLVILGIIVLLLIVFLKRKKKKEREPDYRALFFLGLVWFVLGIAGDISIFYILGLVYLAIGLSNRDRWGKKRKPLTKKQIKIQKIVVTALTLLVILSAVVFLLVKYFGLVLW